MVSSVAAPMVTWERQAGASLRGPAADSSSALGSWGAAGSSSVLGPSVYGQDRAGPRRTELSSEHTWPLKACPCRPLSQGAHAGPQA